MLRLIFLLVFLLCLFVGGLGFALNHWFGWKGMLAFPFVCLVVLWIGKKLVGTVIKRFALSLFCMKSGALRGATIQVQSIAPVASRAQPNTHDARMEEDDNHEDAEDNEKEAKRVRSVDDQVEAEANEAEEADSQQEGPKERFEIDLTITPREGSGDRVWEPGERIFTSEAISTLEELEEKEIGVTENVLVWKDSGFTPDEEFSTRVRSDSG